MGAGTGPPPVPAAGTFPFRFAPAYRVAARPFGIRPSSAAVRVGGGLLEARFGPWRVATPLINVAGATVTGPYRWHRAAGPARYSLADHGLTFASNGDVGLCIEFVEPVGGSEPTGLLRHPSLTVTVDDVEALGRVLG